MRRSRRQVGVKLVGIDGDVVDLVGPRRGEAGLLADPRADVGIGAAVPEHLAGARGDAPVCRYAALDAHGRGMIGDDGELLLHRGGDPHRATRDQRQRCRQGFELDVGLGSEAAA